MTKTTVITDLGKDLQIAVTGTQHPSVTVKYTYNKATLRIKKTDNNCLITNATSFNQGLDNKIYELDYRKISSPVYASNDELYAGLLSLTATATSLVDTAVLVDAVNICSTDDVWEDKGAEIDCSGFKTVGIWVDLFVSDSTGNQLQVLCKNASGGDEYVLATAADFQKTLGDSNIKILYPFDVEGVPIIQIQTKATDMGIEAALLTCGGSAESTFGTWEAVTDGSFAITINGTPYSITGIDFTSVGSMAVVASTIQAAIRAATGGTETVAWSTDHFIITADDHPDSAITVLSTSAEPIGTDISGVTDDWMDGDIGNGAVSDATGITAIVSIDITKEA